MTEVAIVNCIEKMMTERREKILESDEYIRQDVDDLKELEERKAEKVDMEAAGENAPKGGAGKKKATKARMDKAEEEAINAAKAAAFMKDEEEA